ncbi:MAG TPA: hydantoinase/oxoprolinase family protein [Nitrolancea sp.]|nr:hydantoinase/oxoprolinase family protein [Nitrolancea sp.]
MRIGIDVGGTNTDAVIMDGARVVGWFKTPTTPDASQGIITALTELLDQTNVPKREISAVMIGTTHFTNAVVERRRLLEVAAVRLALPATETLPPMVDWPQDLSSVLGNHIYLVHGGHEFDGREIAPIDPQEIREVAADIRAKGIRSAAISSVFSPVNAAMEEQAAEILRAEIPDIYISLSNQVGRLGLLERENATIMNAALQDLARRVAASFRDALRQLDLNVPFYISQNDGTLMSADYAERYPVLTFSSGPTNSMRGAAFLSGLMDAMVVDIGGTTSDVGMLVHGFPREASVSVEIGGVRTNFRMPDVLSFGLGGGSLVRSQDGSVRIGPDSVGYQLTEKGLAFGGDTLTTTDIVVAAGLSDAGDPSRVADVDPQLVQQALDEIQRMVDVAVDRMKTSAADLPVVLVGGGAILVTRQIHGVSEIVKPEQFAVANAIGAAIAQVGGEVDRVFSLEGQSRDQVLEAAKQEARDKAITAGASPDSIQIVDVEDVPLSYLPGNAVRVRVKAVGDLTVE